MLIGIDQGTTGTTCLAVDRQLDPVAESYRALPNRFPHPGRVEQDPEEVVDSVVETVGEVTARIGREPVLAVGLANQGETVVAWDRRSGEALTRAVAWSDTRAREITRRMHDAGQAETVRTLSGLRLDSYFSAAKFAWLLENDRSVQAARADGTLALGTLDAWLAWRLGGRRSLTDHSTASRTQLMRRGGDAWDPGLLASFDVPGEALPSVRPSLGDWGELEHPSWDRPLPWRASLVDQPAALAGHACFRPGDTKVTYGTGCFVFVHAGTDPPAAAEGLLVSTAWSDADARVYALDGGAFTAGTAIQWLQEVGIITRPEETAALAESVPDAGGVQFLPALTGLGSPWWEGEAKGAFAGLTGGTTRAHLVRAVLDSIAFRVRDILEAVWAAGTPRPPALKVDGGLTSNRYLVRRQADVLGIPVLPAVHRQATALGAAAMAGVAQGVLTTQDIDSLLAPGRPVEPGLDPARRDEEYARWLTWRERACRL